MTRYFKKEYHNTYVYVKVNGDISFTSRICKYSSKRTDFPLFCTSENLINLGYSEINKLEYESLKEL